MTTLARILIGMAAGLLVGALLGRLGKRNKPDCPRKADPLRGALLGAMLGAVIMLAVPLGNPTGETLAEHTEQVATVREFSSQVLQSDKPVLVKFFATWCGPCKRLAPTIAKLAREYEGRIVFVSVDGDQAGELVNAYRVQGYPTVMIFADGKVVKRITAYHKIDVYRAAMDAVIEAGKTPA